MSSVIVFNLILLKTEIMNGTDLELETNIFWTGATRTGCAGQWTDCFPDAQEREYFNFTEVMGTEGGCLGMSMVGGQNLGARSLPCSSRLQPICYSWKGFTETVVEDIQIQSLEAKVDMHFTSYFQAGFFVDNFITGAV